MAFTVEDGTIVEEANSFVTVAYADTYHNDRDNTSWTGTDAVKQAALIKATDYIEQKYGSRFIGAPYSSTQSLSWPRSTVITNTDEVPKAVLQAVCELALESFSEALNPTQGKSKKREKVDVIEVEYADYSTDSKKRPAIDGLLAKYVSGGSYSRKTVRV